MRCPLPGLLLTVLVVAASAGAQATAVTTPAAGPAPAANVSFMVAESWVRLRETENALRAATDVANAADERAREAGAAASDDEDYPTSGIIYKEKQTRAQVERSVEAQYRALADGARQEIERLRPEADRLRATLNGAVPANPLPPDLQARADRVAQDSALHANLAGYWATPRGSIIKIEEGPYGFTLKGTYVKRDTSDVDYNNGVVLDLRRSNGRIEGSYYALYSSERAAHIAKCVKKKLKRELDGDDVESTVDLDVTRDGRALTGFSEYRPGEYASGCDSGGIQQAYDLVKLRRLADESAPVSKIALTGSQTDDAIPKNDGMTLWQKMRVAATIAGAVGVASQGDTASARQLLNTLIESPSTDGAGDSPEASAATAGTLPGATTSAATAGAVGRPYSGPYAREVDHLLRNAMPWKLSTCPTCDDFKFPQVQVNTNSQRDQYVAAAVMQAFAAQNHAHIGKPELAAKEAKAMHENLMSANQLCKPGSGAIQPGRGSGLQTLKYWSCPPPLL